MSDFTVHKSSIIEESVILSSGVRIWNNTHIRSGATIGQDTSIGENVFIDENVRIGAKCKIQNGALLYKGTTLEDGVFIGPGCITANDKYPRAINPDGSIKSANDWECLKTIVMYGASLGAGSIICPGTKIGRWALIGAGSLVCSNVDDFSLMIGVPARPRGIVCKCGQIMKEICDKCKSTRE